MSDPFAFASQVSAIAARLEAQGLPFTSFNVMREGVLIELGNSGCLNPEKLLTEPERRQQ